MLSLFFSSDMTMIFYFKIVTNIIIITDPTFSWVLNVFVIFFSIKSSLLKCFFITSLLYLLSSVILLIKLWTSYQPKYDLKGLLNFWSEHNYKLNHNYKQHVFDICKCKSHFDFALHYLQEQEYFQNPHKPWMVILFFFQILWI